MRTDLFRRFRTSRDGVAAIEFALMFPVIVLAMIGISDLSMASKMDRDLDRASASVAQIAKKTGMFDAVSKDEIQRGLAAILGEQEAQAYTVRVDGVSTDGNGTLQTDWTWQPYGSVAPPNPQDFFQNSLGANRGGVIVKIERDFNSLFETGGFGTFKLGATHAGTSSTASRIISR